MSRTVEIKGALVGVTFGAVVQGGALAPSLPSVPGDPGPLFGHYIVETDGKTADQIVAEINRLTDYHAAKSARIRAGEPLLNTVFAINGTLYKWTDITIRERGTDVELYCCAVDSTGAKPACMPLIRVYPSIDAVPTNQQIVDLVTVMISLEHAGAATEAQKVADVMKGLGLQ